MQQWYESHVSQPKKKKNSLGKEDQGINPMNNAIIDYSSKKTRCNCWRNFKLVKLFNFNMLSINQFRVKN